MRLSTAFAIVWVIALALLFFALASGIAHADFDYHFSPSGVFEPGADGLQGLHLDRASTDGFPHGISWDIDHTFAWASGLDVTLDYSYRGISPTPPDLVLAYSSLTHADNLRMRADDARMMLGPKIGHPMRPFQLDVESDYRNSGVCIGTSGWESSLLCFNQQSPRINRTSLNLNNLWSWGTDIGSSGGTDLYLWSYQQQGPALRFSGDGGIGFYGSPPASKPTVTGSWSDGSAAKSLLAAMVKLGLVADTTTP